MSELALRSRFAGLRAARVYGAGSVTDFSALAGGRAGGAAPGASGRIRPATSHGVRPACVGAIRHEGPGRDGGAGTRPSTKINRPPHNKTSQLRRSRGRPRRSPRRARPHVHARRRPAPSASPPAARPPRPNKSPPRRAVACSTSTSTPAASGGPPVAGAAASGQHPPPANRTVSLARPVR